MGKFRFLESGTATEVEFAVKDGALELGDKSYPCDGASVNIDGRRIPFWVHRESARTLVWLDGVVHEFEVDDPRQRAAGGADSGPAGGKVKAQMPGKILQVAVKVGDRVEVDQNLLLMESMKMELALDASVAGTVKSVEIEPGQMVSQGDLLVEIEED